MIKINSDMLIKMYRNGANQLFATHKKINSLNVFPVPDGDTGTNMNFTVLSGLKEIEGKELKSAHAVAKAFAKGCLMGARGNSGVILSQIFKGFAQGLEGLDELEGKDLVGAFGQAKVSAYASVGKPVEGTILTMISDIAIATEKEGWKSPGQFFKLLMDSSSKSLARTPDLLPVLKEAGVVDSGAYGLREFMYGMLAALFNRTIEREELEEQLSDNDWLANDIHGEDDYGYCTEFIVTMDEAAQKKAASMDLFKELETWGDSIAVVTDEEILKIHLHTETPELAMQFAHQFGEFKTIKIENMQEQFEEIKFDNSKKKDQAVIAVSPSRGITLALKERGVSYVIQGGQTMNPSTEDIIKAIKKTNTDKVLILPNNSNIILSAEQAKNILEDVEVSIIPSKTISQGIAAANMFDELNSFEENIEEMIEAIGDVKTGEITNAVKDTTFKGVDIKNGDFLSIIDGEITNSQKKCIDAAKFIIDSFDGLDFITLIVGKDADCLDEVKSYISDKGMEVDVIKGDQPIYPFIIGAE